MQIEILHGDAIVLRDVLTAWLGEVATEIRHTDNPSVRLGLRERRDSIRRIRDLLDPDQQAAS
jgi:hypothetical protein